MDLKKLTKKELIQLFELVHNMEPPKHTKKSDLVAVLLADVYSSTGDLSGAGIGDFFRGLTSKASKLISRGFNVAKRKNPIVSGVNLAGTVALDWRSRYTNETKTTLEQYGKSPIESITIVRTPVSSILTNILNAISFGLFNELMKSQGFDKMFHLALIFKIDSTNIIVEKLAEINISTNTKGTLNELAETMPVNTYKGGLVLDEVMNKTRQFMGDKNFFDYDAFTNNCQNFVSSILTANNLNSPDLQKFLYQDIKEMYARLQAKASYVAPFAKFTTRMGTFWNKITGAGLLSKKEFPLNYGMDAVQVIDLMSFDSDRVQIMGSMAIKSTLYPGDFDLYEVVQVQHLSQWVREFQHKINEIISTENIHLADVKIGEWKDYDIIGETVYFKQNKIIGFDYDSSLKKLKNMISLKIAPKSDLKVLKRNPSIDEFEKMQDTFRYHILRWSGKDILQGYKVDGGKKITLLHAVQTDGLIKVDTLALSRNKFMEFSIIYELRDSHNHRINNFRVNVSDNLREQIKKYMKSGNYFKALKRQFSQLKHNFTYSKKIDKKEISKQLNELVQFFNGDAGILNSVVNDIEAILSLYELTDDIPTNKILNTLNSFVYRLSNVYSNDTIMKKNNDIVKQIKASIQKPDTIPQNLKTIQEKLKQSVNKLARDFLRR